MFKNPPDILVDMYIRINRIAHIYFYEALFLFHHGKILPFFSCCWGIPRQSSFAKRGISLNN